MKIEMHIMRFAIFLLLMITLVSRITMAEGLVTVCDAFTSSALSFPVPQTLSNPSTYSGTMYIALLIVVMVITFLGMVYGIGYAFGINKLMSFVKNEMYESMASIFLIVLIFGGMGTLFSVSSVVTQAAAATATPSATGGLIGSITLPQSPQAMYSQICNQYLTRAAGVIPFTLTLTGFSALLSVFSSAYIYVEPNGFGVRLVGPFSGLIMISQSAINIVNGIAMGLFILYLGVIGILFTIYWLFPIFLYLGIALRSFPWTRAAGGAFIGLFIAFYIIFPSLMYPFSYVNPYSVIDTSGVVTSLSSSASGISTNFLGTIGGIVTGNPNLFDFANFIIKYGVETTGTMLIDVLGVLISFVISYDMLETLGDFFGAPSLQRGKLFSKLV